MELKSFWGRFHLLPRSPASTPSSPWDSYRVEDTEMNERGCSPILAAVSVGTVVFFLACPQALFAVIAVVFSIVFVVGMVVVSVFLFAYCCYCVYEILKVAGRMFGGR
jgi:hypothetical protein